MHTPPTHIPHLSLVCFLPTTIYIFWPCSMLAMLWPYLPLQTLTTVPPAPSPSCLLVSLSLYLSVQMQERRSRCGREISLNVPGQLVHHHDTIYCMIAKYPYNVLFNLIYIDRSLHYNAVTILACVMQCGTVGD